MASNAARSDVRVVIVDDHVLVAEALELALSVEGYDVRRVVVPETPAAPSSLVAAIVRLQPRVVLLNLDLGPYGDGAPLVAPLAKYGADVVVVTGLTDRARWGEVLAAGARTVLSKSQPLNDILATVRKINQGLPVLERADRDALVDVWIAEARRPRQGERAHGPADRARERGARPPHARSRRSARSPPAASSPRRPCAPR